jgi:uncharacterized membrane protein YfcA
MEPLVISHAALLAAALTLFSGFGLGTVLLPVFAVFFPVPVAVAATGVVHLGSNVFKLALGGRRARRAVVLRFGIPAALGAVGGAALLGVLAGVPPLVVYQRGGQRCEVTRVKAVIAVLIIASAAFELAPSLRRLSFGAKHLMLGGTLSGFFDGSSWQQGALRSAFLINAGLKAEEFIGPDVVVAAMVDTVRLVVYGVGFCTVDMAGFDRHPAGLVVVATVAAFVGSDLAVRLMKKVHFQAVRIIVGVMLTGLGRARGAGFCEIKPRLPPSQSFVTET